MISTKQTVRCGLDVIGARSKKEMTDVHKFTIIRIFIVFFIVVSGVITIFKDLHPEVTFIAQMIGVSWGALAGPSCAVPLLALLERYFPKSCLGQLLLGLRPCHHLDVHHAVRNRCFLLGTVLRLHFQVVDLSISNFNLIHIINKHHIFI